MPNTCLLVIDMLNDFLDQWEAGARQALTSNTNALIDACRKASVPVIWVRQEFASDLSDAFLEMRDKNISVTIQGTRGAEIDASLDRHQDDRVIVKKRYSAFFRTSLETDLADLGVTEIILAGVNTHACIRMAAIDAYQRDLRVVIAKDCVGSIDQEHADVSLRYMDNKIARVEPNATIISSLSK
ncbi:MAG: isochorismatase family cysteine hydrolase [Pseudomonadota bacterium]